MTTWFCFIGSLKKLEYLEKYKFKTFEIYYINMLNLHKLKQNKSFDNLQETVLSPGFIQLLQQLKYYHIRYPLSSYYLAYPYGLRYTKETRRKRIQNFLNATR